MLESAIHKNRPLFKTTQHYLETKLGCKIKFILRRNSFCPLSSYFVGSDNLSQYGKNFPFARIPEYAWYPPLSAIFETNDPRPFHILRSHYQGIGTTKAKLQVAYFTLLKKGFIKKFLIPAYILIDYENVDREKIIDFLGGMVFGGQGSKVKIFKFDQGKVLTLLKEGYNEKFLLNEITVRKDFQDVLPLPRLLATDREAGLFEEEYIPATPVRELNVKTWPLLANLFDKLLLYYKKNDVISIPTYEYQSILLNKIHYNSQFFSQPTRQKMAETLSILSENFANDLKDETLLIQGHGDFWLGNILLDKNSQRLLIIDWERSDQYSLMHDLFTLFAIYSAEQGNFKLLRTVLESGANAVPVMDTLSKYHEQFSARCDRSSLQRQLRIFLMEKISFSLSLIVTTPLTELKAQEELDKWNAFVMAILKEGILTDNTQ